MTDYDPSWDPFANSEYMIGYGNCVPGPQSLQDNFLFTIDEHLTRPLKANIPGGADPLKFYRTFEVIDDATLDEDCVSIIMEALEHSVTRHGESVIPLAFQDFLKSFIFHETRVLEQSRSLARIVSRLDTALTRSALRNPLRGKWRYRLRLACQAFVHRIFSKFETDLPPEKWAVNAAFIGDLYAYGLISHAQFMDGVLKIFSAVELRSPIKNSVIPFIVVLFHYIARGQTRSTKKTDTWTANWLNEKLKDARKVTWAGEEMFTAPWPSNMPHAIACVDEFMELLIRDSESTEYEYCALPFRESGEYEKGSALEVLPFCMRLDILTQPLRLEELVLSSKTASGTTPEAPNGNYGPPHL